MAVQPSDLDAEGNSRGPSNCGRLPAGQRPTRKPWTRVSAGKLGEGVSSPVNKGGDPTSTVAMLSASKDVREVGREPIGEVTTTHYRGTYSIADALTKLDAGQRAATEGFYQALDLNSMVFDLWIDGNRLPRRVRVATPKGGDISMAITMGLSGFNVPTAVTAPPRNQVADGDHLRNVPGVFA